MKRAVLVIDMINDFVYGKLGGEDAQEIVPTVEKFLKKMREKEVSIIYTQDAHHEDDPEMGVWGEHAMEGEEGAETIEELEGLSDHIVKTNNYDAFFRTELEDLLEEKCIEQLILIGVSTDICVQNTAAGAFFRGYDIIVLEDCTAAIKQENHEGALEYMKTIYGAEIKNSADLM